MGKPDGWYGYDAAAGAEVEQLHLDHAENPGLHTRLVHAESSGFTYKVVSSTGKEQHLLLVLKFAIGGAKTLLLGPQTFQVDLQAGTQTNTSSGKVRPIRRIAS